MADRVGTRAVTKFTIKKIWLQIVNMWFGNIRPQTLSIMKMLLLSDSSLCVNDHEKDTNYNSKLVIIIELA